jgi:hypothetical protein
MKTESARSIILGKRMEKYAIDHTVLDSINELLLSPDLNGDVRITLADFDNYNSLVNTLNFIRAHYEAYGWTVVDYGVVNAAGTQEAPVVTHETYLFVVLH